MRRNQENPLILRQSGGGAKIPGILVTQPKGVAKTRETTIEDKENQNFGATQELEQDLEPRNWQRGGKRGIKRLKYLGDDSKFNMFSEDEGGGSGHIQDEEQEPPKQEKRRRSRSPDLRRTPEPPNQDSKSPGGKLSTTPP